jgi:uncharacterized membrane protein
MTLLEPAVSLTDLALAIECGLFAAWLSRLGRARLKPAFVSLFAATGVAALLGGISHGLLPGSDMVWRATLIAICVAAFAAWLIGARLALPYEYQKIVTILVALAFAAQSAYILFVGESFLVAIVSYAPAALFLLIAFGLAYRRSRAPYLLAGIAGLALTFIATAAQQSATGLHARYFDHNALYHLIQGAALFLIFWAARGMLKSSSARG